ncbi:MAG: hypothetical protein A2Z03_01200 [Chloroflexi bacterium RBG_16_56_8]|nr:MAG: hypothetical protein A2Z03_01200 [Chloroflexi bacterium RBG_16_56_8]
MEYIVVSLTALLVSTLTLFSGFGLGIVLMPAFALFFPVRIAIAATAIVHLANNLFKASLLGRQADWSVVVRFAVPGAAAAMLGAGVLNLFDGLPPVAYYWLGERRHEITLIKLVAGVTIIAFAFLELLPRFQQIAFDRKYLPWGGIVSGFLGGLSGNQGALRSAFLIKAGLDKHAYVATGTVSAVIVDIARLIVYGLSFYAARFAELSSELNRLILIATLAAFLGAFIGTRLIKKVTLNTIHIIVGIMLIVSGTSMTLGLF